MSRASSQAFSFSAGEAVLGLVIGGPGDSSQLERRLVRRFAAARFVHGTAHQAVKRLAQQGLIRAVDRPGSSSPADESGADGCAVAYEATAAGVAYFEGWLSACCEAPPVREALHAKIAFCGPEDLPRIVEIVRAAELACIARVEELNGQRCRERRSLGEEDWERLMGLIVTTGEAVWWDARLKWLRMLRRCLQEEGQRYNLTVTTREFV